MRLKGISQKMNSTSNLKLDIISYIENNLSKKRLIHTYGVRDTAVKLAENYGLDVSKAELAALFHDMAKYLKGESLNYHVKHLGLDDKYLDNPSLAHSKIAAILMEKDFKVTDKDMVNAVSFHTTGRQNMSQLEKVIYIADAVEPNRDYPGVEKLRKLAFKDLDKACLMSMDNTINRVNEIGGYLDNDTILAAEYLRNEINGR